MKNSPSYAKNSDEWEIVPGCKNLTAQETDKLKNFIPVSIYNRKGELGNEHSVKYRF